MDIIEIPIKLVKIDQAVYPRDQVDQTNVAQLRNNIDDLPPINLTKDDYVLIDGMHRLQAHELEKRETIKAILEDLPADQILFEAIKRNAKHGKQLSIVEKKNLIRKIFNPEQKNTTDLQQIFGITDRTIREWTKDIRQKATESRNEQILALYLQCFTQQEIAEETGVSRQAVGKILIDYRDAKNGISSEIINGSISLQFTNLLKFDARDKQYGTDGYPGSIPGQVLENLLYYHTEPFNVVVDPMAGGGTTIDVCRKMFRRYQGYDLHPLKSRPDIQFNDVRKGFPERAKGCDLIYLDPPYWDTMDYKADSSDKVSKEEFIKFIELLAENSYQTVKKGGITAFICQDVYRGYKGVYRGETKEQLIQYELYGLFIKAGFNLIYRYHVPQTQGQYSGNQQKYAKELNIPLNVARDLLIFQK